MSINSAKTTNQYSNTKKDHINIRDHVFRKTEYKVFFLYVNAK